MPFPVDEKYIIETENKLGARFPDSFWEKMMKENGGSFEDEEDAWELYPFWDKSDKKRMSRTFNDIIRETESAREWETFPKNAIAIASNGCGDHLIFIRKVNVPQLETAVYFWSHDDGEIVKYTDDFYEISFV